MKVGDGEDARARRQEIVAPTRPEAVKVTFDRDYGELEKLINPPTISLR